ncbi:hypothetical protein BH10BAC6_BH10BAC6_04660 [soil metagenome]
MKSLRSRRGPSATASVFLTYMLPNTLRLLLLVSLVGIPAHAQQDRNGSVLIKPRVVSPKEFIQGDTARKDSSQNAYVPGEGSGAFTSQQDSTYRAALQLGVSGSVRFMHSARSLLSAMQMHITARPLSPWEAANSSLNIPSSIFAPSAQEITAYRANIAASQYVPGVLLFPMGTGNLQVSFGDIGKFFGVVEDVSPDISYVVDIPSEVEIVVYSPNAKVIATIFRGDQGPGKYKVRWNGRDEFGKPVLRGDYIAEVRLGRERLQRKRIVWPPE